MFSYLFRESVGREEQKGHTLARVTFHSLAPYISVKAQPERLDAAGMVQFTAPLLVPHRNDSIRGFDSGCIVLGFVRRPSGSAWKGYVGGGSRKCGRNKMCGN